MKTRPENSPKIFKLCGGFALNVKRKKKKKKMDDKFTRIKHTPK